MAELPAELHVVYLQPGEVHLSRRPAILKTILGSCVAVTFWDPYTGFGALCHGVLPKSPAGLYAPEGFRYVDFAIRDLVLQFENLGVRRHGLQVKVFGGADVLPVHSRRRATVGRQNWQTALDVLEAEALDVIASDLGGPVGRSVQFLTDTGDVLVRRLSRLSEDENHLPCRKRVRS